MFPCITQKYVSCCVCYELKNNYDKCQKCKSSYVCSDCIMSMVEHGIVDKCPICKQIDWRSRTFKNTIIVPTQIELSKEEEIVEIKVKSKFNWYQCCRTTKLNLRICNFYVLMLALSYLMGLATIAIISVDIGPFFWLPFLIGIFELILICGCCVKCCKIKFNTDCLKDL